MASPGGGKSVFLIRALEHILSEKEVKRNQHIQLRKTCESALSMSAISTHSTYNSVHFYLLCVGVHIVSERKLVIYTILIPYGW